MDIRRPASTREEKLSEDYRGNLIQILAEVHPSLSQTYRLEFKNSFGAVTGYLNGEIFVACGKFGFALKLSPAVIEQLFAEKNAIPLKYFEKGHIKKDYAVLLEPVLTDKVRLKKLVEDSIEFIRS